MAEKSQSKKPIKNYKAQLLTLSLWENELKEGTMKTFTFQRSYQDSKEEWQNTSNLRISDLPKLKLLLDEAYKDSILKKEQ